MTNDLITCTDRMEKDGVIYTCAGGHGPDEMHRSEEGAVWSPGMGIKVPKLETQVERDMTPGARLVADTLAGSNRTLRGTDEEITAARVAEREIYTDRHAYLLTEIDNPVLHALVVAHGPSSDALFPDCAECPPTPNGWEDEDPVAWPCPVWMFVSDRM